MERNSSKDAYEKAEQICACMDDAEFADTHQRACNRIFARDPEMLAFYSHHGNRRHARSAVMRVASEVMKETA